VRSLNAVFIGRVRIDNCYFKITIPRSWFKEKNAELTDESSVEVYNFSVSRDHTLESPKFVGEGFWTTERGSVNSYTEKRRINIHNRRDRKKGRSTQIKLNRETKQLQGEGEIFRYEAIDSGQTFQAVILVSSEADAEIVINLLKQSPDIWLGGSQSAGYGHTKISHISHIIDSDDWNEINISIDDDDRTNREYFTITLLSELILRDELGQCSIIPPSTNHNIVTPLTRELEKFLNDNIDPISCFTSTTLVGGFSRKWGLPLPTVQALAAGSVFIFENCSITEQELREIEIKGIGEKKIDGFGRVAVNWLNKENFHLTKPNKILKLNSPKLNKDASLNLAEQMAERLLHKKIEEALQKYLGTITINGDISNSQLSRLQLIARHALSSGNCDLVLSLLNNNNLPSNAERQFERAIVTSNNESLKKQLELWLCNPDSWMSNKQDLKIKIADIERSIDDELSKQDKLAEKYTLRLIMALAKKTAKEKNR
jgi:CRISPR-associated protein Csx10